VHTDDDGAHSQNARSLQTNVMHITAQLAWELNRNFSHNLSKSRRAAGFLLVGRAKHYP